MLGEIDRLRDHLVLRNDLVHRAVGEGLLRRERLAFEDRGQGPVGADQAGQPLGAAAARDDAEEDLRLPDEEVSVGHDPQVARPGELRAEAEGGTVEGGDVEHTAGVHPQEGPVQTFQLQCPAHRGPAHHGPEEAGPVHVLGHADDG